MLKFEKHRSINDKGEDVSFETSPYFWECDCNENFIRSRAETLFCSRCGTSEEDRPDARELDIVCHMNEIQELHDKAFDIERETYNSKPKTEPKPTDPIIPQTFGLDDVARVADSAAREDIRDNPELLRVIFDEVKILWDNAVISSLSDGDIWDIILDLEAKGKLEKEKEAQPEKEKSAGLKDMPYAVEHQTQALASTIFEEECKQCETFACDLEHSACPSLQAVIAIETLIVKG